MKIFHRVGRGLAPFFILLACLNAEASLELVSPREILRAVRAFQFANDWMLAQKKIEQPLCAKFLGALPHEIVFDQCGECYERVRYALVQDGLPENHIAYI